MIRLFAAIPILFAADPAPGGGGNFGPFALIGGALLFFYILILRPQQQEDKKRRQMLEAVKKNDRVLTTGGIYGTVVSVDGEHDRVVVRVDDDKNIRIAFTKASIARVLEVSQEKEKMSEPS